MVKFNPFDRGQVIILICINNNEDNNEDYLYSAQSLKGSRRFTKSVTATLQFT